MVAYSFQTMFAEPIIEGRKRQTIRAVGKRRHARPGEELQLYTGMCTKHCRKIGTATCTAARSIRLCFYLGSPSVRIEGANLIWERKKRDWFAREDGFEDWGEMREFWAEHHDMTLFRGLLIEWEGFKP